MNRITRSTAPARLLLLLGALLLASCSSGNDTGPAAAKSATTFVGTLADSEVHLAAVTEGDQLLIYLCDGAQGVRVDGRLDRGHLASEVAGVGELTIDLNGSKLTGALSSGGQSHAITATVVNGKAALLWAKGTDSSGRAISAGWVVSPDGSETGGVVTGIIDGTSNTLRLAGARPSSQQDSIIAILIGLRSPIVSLR